MSQISLTFPDGSARSFKSGVTGRDVAEQISKSLAKKAVAVELDGKIARPRRADQNGCAHPHPHPRRRGGACADPPRRGACDGGSRAGALPRHASHHRPGDRERLLLRLRARRALHARRSAEDRGQDARDHRPRFALHLRGDGPRGREEAVRRQGRDVQARADRRHPRRRRDQGLFASRRGSTSAAART